MSFFGASVFENSKYKDKFLDDLSLNVRVEELQVNAASNMQGGFQLPPPPLSDIMVSYAKIRAIEGELEAQLHRQLEISRVYSGTDDPLIIQRNFSRVTQLAKAVEEIKAGEAKTYSQILLTLFLHQKHHEAEETSSPVTTLAHVLPPESSSLPSSGFVKVNKLRRKVERKKYLDPLDLNRRLDQAESNHEELGGYLCDVPNCGKLAATRFSLRRHLFSHETLKTFNCQFSGCERSFAKTTSLERHHRLHLIKGGRNLGLKMP